MKSILYFISISYLLIITGCADLDNKDSDYCTSDSECEEDYGCGPRGKCIFKADPQNIYMGVEIWDQRLDSTTKGKLMVDFGPSSMVPGNDGYIHLTIPEKKTVSGTLKTSSPEESVDAMIISYRYSNIPGRDIVTDTVSVSDVNYLGKPYSMDFYEDGNYYFQVIPTPADIVPPLLKNYNVNSSSTLDYTLGQKRYIVTGRAVYEDGEPVIGATVWGFDLHTAAASNIFETTSDGSGLFTLSFTQIPTSVSVYIGPGEYTNHIPAVIYTWEDLSQQVQGRDGIIYFETGENELPALPSPVTFGTTIYGTTSSGSKEYVSGAVVSFKSVVGMGTKDNGIVYIEGITDENGNITVEIVPGQFEGVRIYEVTVTPPADSEFASIQKSIEVGHMSGFGESIELSPKINVVGQVTEPDSDAPLSRVMIEANAHTESIYSDRTFQSSGRTDLNGWFSLYLDPGTYDFSMYLPENYLYPFDAWNDIEITENLADHLMFIPKTPGLVKIIIEDAQGNPIKDLEIRAFIAPDECAEPEDECDSAAKLMYLSKTDQHGAASLLVPLD
ncbi:carboxypeptidase-like regulatory domain-containing protein [Myxococcota bacterium]|nr:carboxypeptidase-like regulatory domain-containing protein [Myxococcota bacterium]MBU1380603.1 carboxypeptidase-like regulatory domain-containing protein [Myxococcota bacterium]MBU1497736.1 carboxypeptidase-like regulatory domain-containing protein [Myxococcota bacterium]